MSGQRMQSVDAVRSYQREWIARVRDQAPAGEPFILCNSDEVEDITNAFEIPSLVINYWNFVIAKSGNAPTLQRQLESHGYPGPHFFSLGYATALDPDAAPWDGLPRPRVLVGSSRNDYERRVCELWARKLDCPLYPMDFNFASPRARPLPADWWKRTRSDWRALVDPQRLAGRIAATRAFVAHLESDLGRALPIDQIGKAMTLINRQMDLWTEANAMIAAAPVHPVAFRDQLAIYQAMWHRGRQVGIDLIAAYRDEISERIAKGIAGYDRLERRILFWSNNAEPVYHAYLRDRHGAAIVASPYSAMPAMYARDFDAADPLAALCGRHILLFQLTPEWMMHEAKRHRCDLIISTEADSAYPSVNARAAAVEGIAFVAIPQGCSAAEAEARIDRALD